MKPKIDHYSMHCDIDEDLAYDFDKFYNRCIRKKVTHVTLEINSYGGFCFIMNSICSTISKPGIEWHGYCNGSAQSAALFILRACDYAYASSTAELMFHDDMIGYEGPIESVKIQASNARRLADAASKLFAKKTKKTMKWWKDQGYLNPTNMMFLSPTQALKYGVIDHVGQPILNITKPEIIVDVYKG